MKHCFGRKLKRVLHSIDMSQNELARRCGLTKAAMSHIVNETRDPSLTIVLKILKALPVKPSKLIKGF